MSYSNISAALTEESISEVKAAIKTLENKLPFLIALSTEEKNGLFKQGPKSVDFVQDALDASQNFPHILPPAFDAVEFKKDALLYKVLSDILQPLATLAKKVEDTYTAVGSEALTGGLRVFSYVETAEKDEPELKPVADKLRERFKRGTYKGKNTPPPANS
ncbi:MAG: hypothetical protein WBP45_03015 [Daejeonella sp.]